MVLKLTELADDIDASAEGEDNLGHYRWSKKRPGVMNPKSIWYASHKKKDSSMSSFRSRDLQAINLSLFHWANMLSLWNTKSVHLP